MISIGILGCGRIGQVHALSLARIPNARLSAVADFVPAAAEALAQKFGAEVRSSEDIIAATDIDAVVVATPTTLHYDQIHQLARAGKAIFCEKPIDLSAERAAECAALVAETGVPFMTAFNRRFDPQFAHLQAQLAEGVIGDAELVVITSRDPSPPPLSYIENSGGLFRDMMIHDFDMARFILREEPVEIFASGSCLVDPGIGEAGDVDTAVVTLRTASGKLCQINNSRRAAYGYDQRVEVHGSGGNDPFRACAERRRCPDPRYCRRRGGATTGRCRDAVIERESAGASVMMPRRVLLPDDVFQSQAMSA